MKEEWLDKLRTRLHRECGEEAPRGLLDDIRKEMERRGAVPARPVRQKATTVPMWILRTASAAAVVAMVLYIGSRFGGQSPLPPQTARMEGGRTTDIQVRPMAHPDADRIAAPRTARMPAAVDGGVQDSGGRHRLLACLSHGRTEGTAVCGAGDLHAVQGKPEATPCTDDRRPVFHQEKEKPQRVDGPLPGERNPGTRPSAGGSRYSGNGCYGGGETRTVGKVRPPRFSVGPSFSSTAGTASGGGEMLLATADPYGDYGPEFSGVNVRNQTIRADETRTHTKHRQPVKFGLSVRYALNDRWSLQTGLDYSRHSSEFTYIRGGRERRVEQRLHYVGLPVSASYSLVRTGKVNVYATAGGEIEKLVKGETRQTAEALPAGQEHTAVKEGRPVFSVNAAIGAEYRFGREVSVYVEPGVSRHFNNGSSVENIYKDKPTGFNLSVGVRVQVR